MRVSTIRVSPNLHEQLSFQTGPPLSSSLEPWTYGMLAYSQQDHAGEL